MLKYPDPNKRYVVLADASDQAVAAILTQEYPDADGKITELPVAYLSVQRYTIQVEHSCERGLCYLQLHQEMDRILKDAKILLKSDAKSSEKFLIGRTNNLKLDRWSLELQGIRINC